MGAGRMDSRRSSRTRTQERDGRPSVDVSTWGEASATWTGQKIPVRAGRRVPHLHVQGHQGVTDAVGVGKASGLAGLDPLGQQGLHPRSGYVARIT